MCIVKKLGPERDALLKLARSITDLVSGQMSELDEDSPQPLGIDTDTNPHLSHPALCAVPSVTPHKIRVGAED
jgi:hypothetical protein